MNLIFQTLETAFPRSGLYRNGNTENTLHETALPFSRFPWRERHLQCLWADPRNRPTALQTSEGETVTVEHPGDWNLEPGPDFLNAALLIGKEKRRVTGDLEIHIHPNGWNQHGHADDPNFSNTRFHVVYFQGLEIPGLIQIPLQETLATDPKFSFDNIDTAAFPYAIPSGNFPMVGIDPDQKTEFLEAAGEERLRLKAERLTLAMQSKEPEQVLWEELMAALGYKNNKAPFRKIAAMLPVARLRALASTPDEAYAILLGLSGCLPKNLDPKWTPESKTFIRKVWDFWWKQSEDLHELALKKSDWILAGIRPANHPIRRLMAASFYAFQTLELCNHSSHLTQFASNHWNTHISWKTKCAPTALVGQARANAIITNILIPFRAATGQEIDRSKLPPEPSNAIIRQTAFTLFSPDHSAKIYKSALARQGLIQIFHDYVITHRLDELKIKFGGITSSLSEITNPVSLPEGTLSSMSVDSGDAVPPIKKNEYPTRKHPARHPPIEQPNRMPIIFLTVCTHKRKPILVSEEIHQTLRSAWGSSDQWIVGKYIIMPDHIHLFCSPSTNEPLSIQQWIAFWKRLVSQNYPELQPMWQRDGWDTQLRTNESYSEKWQYVQNNPVRAGLIESPEDWSYQGTLNHLLW